MAVMAVLPLWLYYDAFYVHPDPQSGLVFLVMPMCQLAVVFLLGLIFLGLHLSEKFSRSKNT
jgi:hypothetical protein